MSLEGGMGHISGLGRQGVFDALHEDLLPRFGPNGPARGGATLARRVIDGRAQLWQPSLWAARALALRQRVYVLAYSLVPADDSRAVEQLVYRVASCFVHGRRAAGHGRHLGNDREVIERLAHGGRPGAAREHGAQIDEYLGGVRGTLVLAPLRCVWAVACRLEQLIGR